MNLKKVAISMGFLTMVLTACGKNVVDTTQTNPTPTQTVETQVTPVEEDPEVTIPVVEPTDSVDDPVVEDKYPDATMIQTGEHEYTMHIDCPDNSDAPEIEKVVSFDALETVAASSFEFGLSENLLTAVLTHGMQTNPANMTEINFKRWENYQYNFSSHFIGDLLMTITNDNTVEERISEAYLKSDNETWLSSTYVAAGASLLHDSIMKTDYNITCGLARYHEGPEIWEQIMQECIDATGMTAEEIYANYDVNYVYQYDALGLGNPNYVNEVFQYIGDDQIIITTFDSKGHVEFSNTYSVVRDNQ